MEGHRNSHPHRHAQKLKQRQAGEREDASASLDQQPLHFTI